MSSPIQILQTAWNLRTHPFAPDVDAAGAAIDTAILRMPLDPRRERRCLAYFHDVYNWESSFGIGGISRTAGVARFPNPGELGQLESRLSVIISGPDDSGRLSMRNLLLYNVEKEFGAAVLLTSEKLHGRDRAQMMLSIARNFLRTYAREVANPTPAELQAIYDDESKYPNPDDMTVHYSLFDTLASAVEGNTDRPRVLVAEGGDTYEAWRTVAHSAAPLFHAIVLVTSYEAEAATCVGLLRRDNRNASLITARALTKEQAEDYIRTRLSDERHSGTAAGLTPFTPDALETLYEPGSNKNEAPRWTVGGLNRTLGRAIDERLDAASADPIDGNFIRSVRSKMNAGK